MGALRSPAPALWLVPLALFSFWLRDDVTSRDELALRTDGESAYHLRRIELALAAGRVPLRDHFLDPPHGSEVPWPPAYDGLLAMLAEPVLARPGGDPALAGVDERRLEDWLARAGPLIGVACTLLIFGALRMFLGARGAWVALGGAALYAVLPWAVQDTAAGRLHLSAWMALGVALSACAVAWALTARDALDVLLAALLAGFVSGVWIASGIEAALFVPWTWFAFLLAALRAPDAESAQTRWRAGLFFSLVTALVTTLGQVNQVEVGDPGLASGWMRAASSLSFVSALPFLLMGLRRSNQASRFRALALTLGTLAAVLFATGVVGDLRAALAPRLAAWLAGGRVLVSAELIAICTPLVALSSALAVDAGLRRGAGVARLALALGVVALLSSALQSVAGRGRTHNVAASAELVQALDWMRHETPSPGPWNSADTPKDWCVLAPASVGLLVAYRARRPALLTSFGPLVGAERFDAGRQALAETDPERFIARLRELEVRYVIAGSAVGHGRGAAGSHPSVYDSLCRLAGGADELHPELQRVHASGAGPGPVAVAVYRLAGPPVPEAGPVMRAR